VGVIESIVEQANVVSRLNWSWRLRLEYGPDVVVSNMSSCPFVDVDFTDVVKFLARRPFVYHSENGKMESNNGLT